MEEAAKVIREQSLFGLTASEANERGPALLHCAGCEPCFPGFFLGRVRGGR